MADGYLVDDLWLHDASRRQESKIRAWTYFVGSNFNGVMCLLPYLIFRQPNHAFVGKKDQVLQIFDQRSTGVVLLIATIILLAYAIGLGDWSDYLTQFRTEAFVHLISLDFCTMVLILPITSLVQGDMVRRGLKQPAIA